ncbi:MAG: hypothetical protein QCH31_04675 [Methanolobus sp.]|nr:hypothetical protein [Methanolobus sp.]
MEITAINTPFIGDNLEKYSIDNGLYNVIMPDKMNIHIDGYNR